MLAVQQKSVGVLPRIALGAFNHPGFELYLAAGFQRHDGANWKPARYTCQQPPNPVIIPHPATLEIGQLNLATVNIVQQHFQRNWISFEHDGLQQPH